MIVVLWAPLSNSEGGDAATGDYPCDEGFISMYINGGTETFGGGPGDVFNPGWVMGFGLGGRYQRMTFMGTLQIGAVRDFKSAFLGQTQWSEANLAVTTTSVIVDFGYRFRDQRKLCIEPFLGARLSTVGDAYEFQNWTVGGNSKLGPTAGTRFKWHIAGDLECESISYLIGEIRLSALNYDSDELGNGYSVQILLGIGGDVLP